MDGIKVIFLDIDGVLNNKKTTRTTANGCTFVEGKHLSRLKYIINATGAKIVLTSEWRRDRTDLEHNGDYLELKEELRRYGIYVYGCTPVLPSDHRGSEIAQWLREHNSVSDFVILDDRGDMDPYMDRLVRTATDSGLGIKEAGRAIEILIGDQCNVEF